MSDYAFRQKLAEIGQNYIKSAVEKPSAPGVGPNEQYEEDLRTLGPAAFTAKYGSAAQAKRVTDVYEVDPLAIAAVKNNTRSEAELALDMGSQVTSAGVRAIGSIANLGVRGVDLAIQGLDPRAPGRYGRGELPERFMGATDTAQGVMDTIGGATDALAGALIDQESDNMKAKSAIAERGVAAKKADSQLEYDASDKSMSAMLSKVGRDITIEAEKYENNPAIVGKTANEAFGSMFPSVKATSALTKLANPAIDALGLGAKTTAAAKTAVTAAGVGAIEGQGAYDSTVSQIRDMSFEELEAGSADYKELLAEGMDPEAARDAVAVKAGEKARLVQMGFATIAGGFVSKFEGGDLVKKAAAGFDPEKTLAANLLDEGLGFVQPLAGQTVEEGFQSGTGQLSGNLAVKEFADKDLDLTEGVGEGVVQGAVGGFNATQTLLAPGELGAVFNRGTQGVTALAAVAAKAGAEAAETRADNKSPVGAKATAQNISTLDNILNKASGIFKEQAAAVKAAQEQGLPELPENVQMLMETGKKITDGFLDTESDEFVKKTATFKGDVVPGSRVKTLEKVLRKLNADAYSDPKVSKAASEFAVEETHALREFIERAQEEALKREEAAPEAGADPTPAPLSLEEQVAKLASQVMQNKLFSTGFDKAEAILNKADTPAAEAAPLTPREAITNPVGVNPARVSVTDTSTFSPNQTRALKVIEAIQSPAFAKLNAPVIDSKDRAKTRENTREELLFRDKQATWGNIPSFNTLVSLALKGGIKGLQPEGKTEIQGPGGQQVDSQDVMVRMRQLIEHQVNKFNAGVKSFEFSKANPGKNSELTFKALNPYTYQFKEDGGKFFVNAGSEGSMKTFRQVREDTNAAIRGYNALLENFPEIYKGEKIALLPELTEEAKPNVQPTQPAEAKPEPTKAEEVQSSVDPKADNASGDAQPVPADPVQYTDDGKLKPDYLEFNALFKGGTETTFLDAMKYLNSLGHMTAEQRNLFELLRNSTFFKANHNVVIRLGKPEERQSDKTHGWYNPELKEMVIFAPRISKVLHEMVHATTIEILTKNLLEAYRVDGKLTPVQEAAKTLLEMTNEFIDTPSNSEKVNALRQTMRDMINGSVDQVTKNDGKVRAVSEFMAYGLTEKFVTRDLKNTQYARPSIAKQLKTILLNMFGIKTNDGKAPIAKVSVFDKLVFETQTLSRDTSTTFSAAPVSTKAPEPAAVVPDPVVEPQPAEKLAEAPSVVEPSTPTPEPSAVADAPPQAAAVPVEATPPPVTAAASQPVETKTEATKEAAPPDLETVKAMQEELDTYESELEGSREQLAKYHAPLKDILSLEEFTAVAREASSKKEQSKLIKETAVYKSAISKIEAYEKANPEDMLIEVGLELAVDVVKDMRGSMYQIARMKNMIARENGEQEAKSAKADPVPAVAEPEVKQVTEKPKVKTPVEKAPAVAPVAPIKAIEKEASTTPKIQVGLNLAKNLYGEVEALGVYTFNPIFRYEDDVIELIKEARDAEKLDYKIDDAATMPMVESLLAQVESMIEGMTEKLNVDIRERKHSSGKTIYQILKDNREGKGPKQKDGSTVEALALAEGKSMAFLDDESLDTDVVRYDEHLLRLALMAAVDFVMNTPNGGGLYKTQDILDALGLNEAKDIPDGAYDVINFGRSAIDIKKALAKHIRDFWGAKVNKDAPRSLTEGLAEAMADDIMDYFQDLSKDTDAKDATQFWMKKAVVNLDTGETQTFVSFKLGEQGKEFGAAKTILRDVLTNKDSDSHKYRLGEGYSKKEISNTLKSDDNILVSEDKREAMFKQQNTPFKIAGGFFTMLESFGKDFSTVAEILGFQRMDDADQFFNDYDRKTIEGKNSSIKTSINQVLEQVERMRAYAELKGMDIEDVAAYYRLEISLNGRYFMQGFNPQSNKLAREIFSAAQSTVDLTSAGDVMVLFAAIGQAMDQSDL